jgi:hypothetical protein
MTIGQNTEDANIPINFVVEHYDNDLLAEANEKLALVASRLEAENAKLRKLVQSLYRFSFDEYPDGTELNFADRLRELGIEV